MAKLWALGAVLAAELAVLGWLVGVQVLGWLSAVREGLL